MGITEQLYQELRARLENGVYPSGSKFPSESVLADEFGINKMTMNKIVSMLAEQGYLIRGIRGAGTRVAKIGARARGTLAFLGHLKPYGTRVLQGVAKEAARHGFTTIIEAPSIEELQQRLDFLKNSGINGLVSIGYGILEPPQGMHLFCVDHAPPASAAKRERIHFINSDNFQGGQSMMKEILRRGHREILIFSAERFVIESNASITPRVQGFHETMKTNGISDFEERTFYSAPDSLADARRFLRLFLKRYPATTLIAADSDGSAELIHLAARELNLECPGGIALTGFGNISRLPIASVNQNPERQGELAARHLISFVLNGAPAQSITEIVDTEITGMENIPILTAHA